MRNINNLQLKPSISRALKLNSSFAQEPESTRNAPKHVVEILDALVLDGSVTRASLAGGDAFFERQVEKAL
jgi:hypothetical protein